MFRRGPVGGVAGGRFGKSPGGPGPGTWDLGPGGSRDKRGLGVCRRVGWQTQDYVGYRDMRMRAVCCCCWAELHCTALKQGEVN